MGAERLRRMTLAEFHDAERAMSASVKACLAAGAPREAYRADRALFTDHEPIVFREGAFAYDWDGGKATVVAALNKKPRGEWGRYVNVYAIYVPIRERGNGYAVAAYRDMEELAREQGCSRIVTVAATYGGWRTHRRLGYPAWGTNRHGEILSDAPLTDHAPDGVPPRAAMLPSPRAVPLSWGEQVAILKDPAGAYRLPMELEVKP